MHSSRRSRARTLVPVMLLAVAALAGALWWAARWITAPGDDPALGAAATRAIEDYLERGPGLLTSGRLRGDGPERPARWFCTVGLIEVQQRVRGRAVAGVVASCGEFAAVGGRLLEGTAFANLPMRVTMAVTDGRLSVRQIEQVSNGAGFADRVGRLFSAAGAREVLRRQGSGPGTPSPLDEARQAFGLPATAQPREP